MALAVEINGKIVGLAQVGKEKTEAESHVASFGIGLIKEARGRGIGKELLNAVIAEAKIPISQQRSDSMLGFVNGLVARK